MVATSCLNSKPITILISNICLANSPDPLIFSFFRFWCGGGEEERGRESVFRASPMPVSLVDEADGMARVILTEPTGSSAEVLLHGGQIVSWKNEGREELLFVSRKNLWKSPKAIRGGISLYCPQFTGLSSVEQTTFSRNKTWSLDSHPSPMPLPPNQSSVDLILKSTDDDFKACPRSFELRLRVSLGPCKLTLVPRLRNTDSKAFSFTFSLRNYLSVSDISEVRIEGLETLDYFDNLVQRERFTEQADAITFDEEIDRTYLSSPSKIAVIDHEKKRTLVLRKDAMPDAGVWNPWERKGKALPDLAAEDYKYLLCVDSAAVETPVVLKPFEEWKGLQELCIVSSSYCSGQLDPRRVLQGFH